MVRPSVQGPTVDTNKVGNGCERCVWKPLPQILDDQALIVGDTGYMLIERTTHDVARSLDENQELVAGVQVRTTVGSINEITNCPQRPEERGKLILVEILWPKIGAELVQPLGEATKSCAEGVVDGRFFGQLFEGLDKASLDVLKLAVDVL